MKKSLFTIEFILVFIILVLPPIVFPAANTNELKIQLSLNSIYLLAASLYLYFSNRELLSKIKISNQTNIFVLHSQFLISFSLLIAFSLFFQILFSKFLNNAESSVSVKPVLPANFIQYASFFAQIIISAFYEEILYRFYIPQKLRIFIKEKYFVFAEIFSVLIFAFSHKYQGIAGISNAFFSGLILRFLFVKSGNIFVSALCHIFYNIFIFFISALI